MLTLHYLPANMAWVFTFGSDVSTATIEPMGDRGRFFPTREDAVEAAAACRLRVLDDGRVVGVDTLETLTAEWIADAYAYGLAGQVPNEDEGGIAFNVIDLNRIAGDDRPGWGEMAELEAEIEAAFERGLSEGLNVERVFPSGAWCVYASDASGHLVTRQYLDYTRQEAMGEFRRELQEINGRAS